jgi:hypothetical protein
MTNKSEVERLFQDTKAAFDKAPIKLYASEKGFTWSYSILSTRPKLGATMLVGFNWGAAGNHQYAPQSVLPNKTFKQLFENNELGSFQRVYSLLNEYFAEDVEDCVQTNYCFFRSKMETEITSGDLALSTPLFNSLIELLQPKRIIGFSKKLHSYYLEHGLLIAEQTATFQSNTRTLTATKGILEINGQQVSIYFLPHPNAKFTTAARKNAWDYCFR